MECDDCLLKYFCKGEGEGEKGEGMERKEERGSENATHKKLKCKLKSEETVSVNQVKRERKRISGTGNRLGKGQWQ